MSRANIYITKVSEFLTRTISANLCLSISLTLLVIGMALEVVIILQVSSPAPNYKFALIRDRKSIPKTASLLILTSKQVSSKNRA